MIIPPPPPTESPDCAQVAFMETHGGTVRADSLEEMSDLALEGSKAVSQFMRSCLLAHTTKLAVCRG